MGLQIDIKSCNFEEGVECLVYKTTDQKFLDVMEKLGVTILGQTKDIKFIPLKDKQIGVYKKKDGSIDRLILEREDRWSTKDINKNILLVCLCVA